MSNWSCIIAASLYLRGTSAGARKVSVFGGSAVHTNRLLNALKVYAEHHYEPNVAESLGNHSWLIACFDNGQDGLPLRYQQFGSCNVFCVVTVRFFQTAIMSKLPIYADSLYADALQATAKHTN